MKKKIVAIVFAVIFCFLAFPVSAFAEVTNEFGKIEESSVLDDLEKWGIDITDYQKDVEATHGRMLRFLEYGYDYYGNESSYGLYVYFWNPSGRPIDLTSTNHYIQMQVKLESGSATGSGWSKYRLQVCNYSMIDGYEHVFYKFKVLDVRNFRNTLSRDFRHYEISGIELKHSGDRNATEYKVGGLYSFTGFMPYCNAQRNAANTLHWYVRDRTVIDLGIHQTSWKTRTSEKGAGYQYEVYSVYFSVPNDIIRDYGNTENITKGLVQVDGEFDEQKINGVITSNGVFYEDLVKYIGVYDTSDDDIPFIFYANALHYNAYDNSLQSFWETVEKYWINRYCVAIKSSTFETNGISSDKLLERLYEVYDDLGYIPVMRDVDDGKIKGQQSYSVKAGKDLADSLSSYASCNSWLKALLTGNLGLYIAEDYHEGIDSIQVVTSKDFNEAFTDEAIADELFIDKNDVDSLEDFVSKSEAENRTTYLLRFAIRDYLCYDALCYEKDGFAEVEAFDRIEGDNFYFEKTVFFNFDILTMTWEDEYHEKTVIPVVASPIDVVGSLSPPEQGSVIQEIVSSAKNIVDGGFDLLELLSKLKPWIRLIVVLIVVGVVFFFLSFIIEPFSKLFDNISTRKEKRHTEKIERERKYTQEDAEERRRDAEELRKEREEARRDAEELRKDRRERREDRKAREDRKEAAWRRDHESKKMEIDTRDKHARRRLEEGSLNLKINEDTRRQENHDYMKSKREKKE